MRLNNENGGIFMIRDELSIKDNILRTALDTVFIVDMLNRISPIDSFSYCDGENRIKEIVKKTLDKQHIDSDYWFDKVYNCYMEDMDAILFANTDKKQDYIKKKEHYEKLLVGYISEHINLWACRTII